MIQLYMIKELCNVKSLDYTVGPDDISVYPMIFPVYFHYIWEYHGIY